jgi:hypothetical protein
MNVNIYKFLFTLLVVVFPTCFFSQILNIDRENGQDSLRKKFKAALTANFSNDKQRNNFIQFTNTSEMEWIFKSNYFLLLLNNSDFAINGIKILENNGFIQIRVRDNDTRKIAPDVFSQYQWNGVWGMERRALLGANARINCMEKRKSDLYISTGLFYENEIWNPFLSGFAYNSDSLVKIERELFRLNIVAKFAFKLGSKIDFAGISYVQFPLNSSFLKPRWTFDSNLFYDVSKNVNLVLHYSHNYDEFRPLPIDNFFYELNFGVMIKL